MTLSDRSLAGMIAGKLFRLEAWLSFVAGALLLLVLYYDTQLNRHRSLMIKIVAAMVVCTLLSYFALQPAMAALREASISGALMEENKTRFALLHGAASAVYLIQSVLGLILVLKNVSAIVDDKRASASVS